MPLFCIPAFFGLQARQSRGNAGASRWSGRRGAHRGFAGRRKRRAASSGHKPLRRASAVAHQPHQVLARGLSHSSRSGKAPSQGASYLTTNNVHALSLASASRLARNCQKLFEAGSKEKQHRDSACHEFKGSGLLPEEEE